LSKKRVALILSGQPRFVDLGWSSKSHLRVLRQHEVEVFGHMWFDDLNQNQETAPWSGLGSIAMPAKASEIVKRQYPGGIFLIEPPRKFDVAEIADRIKLGADPDWPYLDRELGNLHNTASHIFSLHKAIELAMAHHTVRPFDYFVVSRYDSVLGVFPTLRKLKTDTLYLSDHHDRFPDMIFLGSPNAVSPIDGWSLFETGEIDETCMVGERVKEKAFKAKAGGINLEPIWMTSLAIRSASKSKMEFSIQLWHYEAVRLRNKAVARTSTLVRSFLGFLGQNTKV
jgi:hypothetical protein